VNVLQGNLGPMVVGREQFPEGGVLGVFKGVLTEEVACVDLVRPDEVVAGDPFCEGFYRVEMASHYRTTVSFSVVTEGILEEGAL